MFECKLSFNLIYTLIFMYMKNFTKIALFLMILFPNAAFAKMITFDADEYFLVKNPWKTVYGTIVFEDKIRILPNSLKRDYGEIPFLRDNSAYIIDDFVKLTGEKYAIVYFSTQRFPDTIEYITPIVCDSESIFFETDNDVSTPVITSERVISVLKNTFKNCQDLDNFFKKNRFYDISVEYPYSIKTLFFV